jgi:class 3 adenylate cyclase
MEREIRKTFVLKRRVRYKGVVITHEQKKSEQLLLNILPATIATKLKDDTKETFIAESYKEVSCMFIKILGVEEHAKNLSANESMGVLNAVFSEFDRMATMLKLEKIKTIGPTYMVVGGLAANRESHLEDIADMSLRVRKLITGYKNSPYPLDVQIGISVGPCVAGIIGTKRISFDLW